MFSLIQKNKSKIKNLIPQAMLESYQQIYRTLKRRRIEYVGNRFSNYPQPSDPIWLDISEFHNLSNQYPSLYNHIQNYFKESYDRSQKEAQKILSFIPNELQTDTQNFLEFGCGDGLVSYFLRQYKHNTVAIDLRSESFSELAFNAGVKLLTMDAADLKFEDNKFDFVFSFNGFEHFSDPEKVLQEAIRVTKDQGFIYLQFSPLYFSPFGLHSWELINIPYCHLLFSRESLQNFLGNDGRDFFASADRSLNGWSWQQFRHLWHDYSSQLTIRRYYEGYDADHLDLVCRYLPIFKSKTQEFNNLVCDRIEVLFEKNKSIF
jgi:SAM-dependent methyltransferase